MTHNKKKKDNDNNNRFQHLTFLVIQFVCCHCKTYLREFFSSSLGSIKPLNL